MKTQAKAKPDMKSVPATRRKKDLKMNVAAQDTIADTIAFVIKGQLTPIKPTPLPDSKKPRKVVKVVKRANKEASPPVTAVKVKTTTPTKTPKQESKTAHASQDKGSETQPKKKSSQEKEDLNSSIQKIIKRYAKKFNIKRGSAMLQPKATGKKTKLNGSSSDAKKSPKKPQVLKKFVKRKDADVPAVKETSQTDESVKIKEEKIEADLAVKIKTEPEIIVEEKVVEAPPLETDVKQEPSDSDPPFKPNLKKKASAQKLRLLKKKALAHKDDKRRSKLIQFWNSPKRHREASLNALAKVHCLYENESKAAFEKIGENSIIKAEPPVNAVASDTSSDSESDEQPVKRTLRNVPGLRAVGKHWDMFDCLSSDNSDIEMYRLPNKSQPVRVKKEAVKKAEKIVKKMDDDDKEDKKKRKPKQEVYMDLKDMVVKKRMASLNASAILAASYSTDKKSSKPNKFTDSSSYDSDSSAEEYFAAIEQIDLTKDPKEEIKQEEDRSLIEVHTTPNKKVAVILNQDTDVTITGVYVNSTTRSTHHEGYCSIAGMQYRISATSHTQTAATTVATETLLQSASSSDNAPSDAQSCSSKSYTPLDALSNMQPPPGPGIHNTLPAHPGIPCQVGSSPPHRQHPASSAFSSPHHGPPGYPQPIQGQRGPPPPAGGESHPNYVHGYYQPAGPLISLSHHGQPPVVQPPLPKSVPLSDASPTSLSSSINQPPGPPAPSSINGDSSDNEVIITSVTAGTKELPPPPSHPPSTPYRNPQFSQYHSYPCPPMYHYQTPPPPQTPPYPHHDLCYPTAPPAGFLRHSKYAPSPSTPYHRYPYYSGPGELYPASSVPPTQPSQQMVTASPISAGGSYPGVTSAPPPPPAIMEPYPPPPAPPTLVDAYQPSPHYYPSAYSLPPTCYSHSPSRAIQYINATYQHCPCPLNTCPKNGHTGPLTGESKRSNIPKDSKPLPPVALALPLEPVSATGPPSPARGSAGMPSGGMPPAPSPAGANYQQPPPKQEARSPEAKTEKRTARVGKEMVRKNIRMNNTMLLMCNPAQNCVKREIESPPEKREEIKEMVVIPPVPEACTTTTTCPKPELNSVDLVKTYTEPVVAPCEEEVKCVSEAETATPLPKDTAPVVQPPPAEPLPPCIATVAENVKVKNMKRKQSQTKETAPETAPQEKKKKKVSSYKDFIRKHKGCFKISNGKKKLVSKSSSKAQETPKMKIKTAAKKKLNATKEQTNNRRIKRSNSQKKGKPGPTAASAKLLDNLISKNSDKKQVKEDVEVVKKTTPKAAKVAKPPAKVKNARGRRKSILKCKSELESEGRSVRRSVSLPRWSNGWTWEGESYEGKVFINSDETTLIRKCYPSMRHKEGDLIRPGDCVLLKAGPRKNDLPYVAKIAALWENPDDGEMMMSLLWYYRPEHTEQGRMLTDQPDEVFASRHKDSNSVACIDDKCYVLTFNEYCRYKKNYRRLEEGVEERRRIVPLPDPYPRLSKQPPANNISPEMVFFCRKVYDFRQKRIIKNPT